MHSSALGRAVSVGKGHRTSPWPKLNSRHNHAFSQLNLVAVLDLGRREYRVIYIPLNIPVGAWRAIKGEVFDHVVLKLDKIGKG